MTAVRQTLDDLGGAVDGEGSGSTTPAQKVVDEIIAMGGKAVANGDSVSDPAGAERMVKAAVENFGKIDGVINNAGILRDSIFHKMSYNDFKAVIDVHLMGTFNVSKAACAFFKDQGSTKRTLYALGVRITLAILLIITILYGVMTGQLGMKSPWQQGEQPNTTQTPAQP